MIEVEVTFSMVIDPQRVGIDALVGTSPRSYVDVVTDELENRAIDAGASFVNLIELKIF